MRRVLIVLGLLLVSLLLFSYFYLPSESMDELYQKIPEQVRENSKLVAAYYYSKTGFDGFREYQFALYNPENKTISVYTFKITKLLKVWPRMKEDRVTCKTPFNYSVLATSPEKLNDFKNCDNCRELLYKDRVYMNEEIESIYPSIEEIIGDKKNGTYVQIAILKDSEITTGTIVEVHGDVMFSTDDAYYGGLLYLPSPMLNFTRGVVVEFLPVDNKTIKRVVHYPGNVTLSNTMSWRYSQNTTWTLSEVPIGQILQELNSKQLQKAIGENVRVRFRIITDDAGKVYAWMRWIDKNKNIHAELGIYPSGKMDRRKFDYIYEYYCN
ncbi:hypothetical protein [Thermococcus waiotapuensis]|uniref:Uncharacterized protein n=1 Tax=Thermococcus waiotapuensis TaxID=90909 RepID=A0AAE4T3B0_9EURY|nr:hypothetical protein [Thermococcus waiotapuensis]MDV3103551.1 hypothetical protein [Thermococcus waiotapuensis]